MTYSMTEDVQRAIQEIKEYDGQKITLCVSKKKRNEKKKPGMYVCMYKVRIRIACTLDVTRIFSVFA